jgi:hypothetical protein
LPGIIWQQWMCAAVSGVVKPKNDAMICIVWAVGSSTTATLPAPGELLGGVSFAPEKDTSKGHCDCTGSWCRQHQRCHHDDQRDIPHFSSP